jgi:hypothetical protein
MDTSNFLKGDGTWAAVTAGAHKDNHDPQDGSDALDTANAAEIVGVQAAGTGTSHSFARADHAHQIQESMADNHLVTVNDADAASGDFARFTATGGLEGRSNQELADEIDSLMKLDDFATPDDNTDLNASTTRHGLLKKLDNVATNFMNGQGNWAAAGGGAWTLAEEEIDSSTCGAGDNAWWDWDLSSVTGGGYFLGLFLIQKNTAADDVDCRINGDPDFEGQTFGSIEKLQGRSLSAGVTLAFWMFSDANSVVEIQFDDVSDGDKAMLITYVSFTPPQAWA